MTEEQKATTAMQAFTGVTTTSFGDRDVARSDQIPKYSGKEGMTDRIAIVDPNLLMVARAHGHFTDDKNAKGLGYVLCRSTFKRGEGGVEVPDKVATCCQMLPEAKKRCVTLVIKYACDPRTGKATKPVEYNPMAWQFSTQTYENLLTIHEEFGTKDAEDRVTASGIGLVDLIMTCEDEKFQRMKIVPSPQRVMAHPEFLKQHGEFLASWVKVTTPRLAKILGRDVTDQEIVQKLGGGSGVGAPPVTPMRAPAEVDALFD